MIHHISCLFCPQINFVLFIGIIIILVQKLQSPDIGGNESSIYLLVKYIYIPQYLYIFPFLSRTSLQSDVESFYDLIGVLCDWQASGSLHSSPHSSVWSSLHRVCFHSRRCQQKRTTRVWTWSWFFSGRSPILSSHICTKRQHKFIVFICLDFMCILCTIMHSLFDIIRYVLYYFEFIVHLNWKSIISSTFICPIHY